MRLFLALELPRQVAAEAVRVQQQLVQAGVRGKFTRCENMHITLLFLGDAPADTAGGVALRIKEIRVPAFELCLGEIGAFDNGVVYIGVEGGAQPLHDALKQALGGQHQPFRPHITLMRQAGYSALPAIAVEPIPWRADAYALYESLRRDDKLVYRPLQKVNLPGSGGGS